MTGIGSVLASPGVEVPGLAAGGAGSAGDCRAPAPARSRRGNGTGPASGMWSSASASASAWIAARTRSRKAADSAGRATRAGGRGPSYPPRARCGNEVEGMEGDGSGAGAPPDGAAGDGASGAGDLGASALGAGDLGASASKADASKARASGAGSTGDGASGGAASRDGGTKADPVVAGTTAAGLSEDACSSSRLAASAAARTRSRKDSGRTGRATRAGGRGPSYPPRARCGKDAGASNGAACPLRCPGGTSPSASSLSGRDSASAVSPSAALDARRDSGGTLLAFPIPPNPLGGALTWRLPAVQRSTRQVTFQPK